MPANVWFEQVNIGLIEELKRTLRVRNRAGVFVPLPDSSFIVRKPEEDLKFGEYPCCSIYNKDYKFDPARHTAEPVRVSDDKESHRVLLEEPCVPFNLTYQIDLWTRYQTDMDDMTRTWLSTHFRQFNLSVVDDGGVIRSCSCMMQGSIIKSDLVESQKRLFHSIINLVIWVELDNETRYNVPMVTNREILM